MTPGIITYDPNTDTLSCTCGNRTDTDGFVAIDENGIECEPDQYWNGTYSCQNCSATCPNPLGGERERRAHERMKRIAKPMIERDEDWQRILNDVKDEMNLDATDEVYDAIMEAIHACEVELADERDARDDD